MCLPSKSTRRHPVSIGRHCKSSRELLPFPNLSQLFVLTRKWGKFLCNILFQAAFLRKKPIRCNSYTHPQLLLMKCLKTNPAFLPVGIVTVGSYSCCSPYPGSPQGSVCFLFTEPGPPTKSRFDELEMITVRRCPRPSPSTSESFLLSR